MTFVSKLWMRNRFRLLGAATLETGAHFRAPTFLKFNLLSGLWALSLLGFTSATNAETVRIGYQKSGAFLLVKSEGSLEEKLKPLGWTVEWDEFAAGVPLLESLAAGRLDVGHSGDAPMIFAQVAGSPLVYLSASRPSPLSVGLLVPKNSPIKNVAELKGKRVIVGKGSSAHFFLVRALVNAGLSADDVVLVYLNPGDARAAFEQGQGDAWAVWDPFLASAEVNSQARVLRSGKGLSSFREFYIAHEDFAKTHPEIVKVILAQLEEVGARAKQDPQKIAAFLAAQLKIDLPTLEKSEYRKFRYGSVILTPDILAEQQSVADLFFQSHLVPKHVNVADIVWHPAP